MILSTFKRLELRRRCQTDLFYLVTSVLGYDQATEFTHRAMADHFLQKDPQLDFKDQAAPRKRLQLAPRFTFKSTFNIADSIQYVLCWPDISVLTLTATMPLGVAFVDEAVDYFVVNDDEEMTVLQDLFPEHCIKAKDRRVGTYKSPARKRKRKDPTLWAKSIEQSLSGWHPDVIKADDIVDNRNYDVKNPDSIAEINHNLDINTKMLGAWGRLEMAGTRYGPGDAYEIALDRAKKNPKDWKVMIASACKFTPQAMLKIREGRPDEIEEHEMTNLFFPEQQTFPFLKADLCDNVQAFFSQRMNDPVMANEVIFTKEEMNDAIVSADSIPPEGEIRVIWDVAYKVKKNRDYTEGVIMRFDPLKAQVLELIHGQFMPSDLAFKVANTARTWGTHKVAIEDSNGVRFLETEILRNAAALEWELEIDWIEVDNSDHAKEVRVKELQPLIKHKRLLFSDAIARLEIIHNEFTKFGLIKADGIPDVIALACKRYLSHIVWSQVAQKVAEENEQRKRDFHDRIYGIGRHAPVVIVRPPDPYQLDSLLGGLPE